MPRVVLIATLLFAAALAPAGEAFGEQPMDRLQRLLDQGKSEEAVEIARKWLSKNEGDRRTGEVLSLVDKGTWQTLAEEPDLGKLAAYRAEFPDSEHEPAARELEANLAYYAAIKTKSEDAFRAVVDSYAGTKAATEALPAAAEAGFIAAQKAASGEAWSQWLSRYPGTERVGSAEKLLYDAVWAEAEELDTAQGWLELRAAHAGHPRADEARDREATLTIQATSGQAPLMKAAARYKGTEAGRSALRRSLFMADVVALRAGASAFGRDDDGAIVVQFEEQRQPLGKFLQRGEPLPADTIAVFLATEEPLPRQVAPQWMRTGIEPARPAGWLTPSDEDSDLTAGVARDEGLGMLGLRAEGFGNLEVELAIAGAPGDPAVSGEEGGAPAPALRPPSCQAPSSEVSVGLLRSWTPCDVGLVSSEPDGYWLSSAEAWRAASVPLGDPDPTVGAGCPVPGPTTLTGDDDDSAAPAAEPPPPDGEEAMDAESPAADPSGDDDDSAAPEPPSPPAWAGLPAPASSASRDLDGDGVDEGLHLMLGETGTTVIVVDGRGLASRVFVVSQPVDAAVLSQVRHTGCTYVLPLPPVTE
ncbi:MAG: hypothetical protein KDA24_16180 [Deltaproteobacteria bacterium]|nr:hypothetical protein [Deltaproteobacteria bacterium]